MAFQPIVIISPTSLGKLRQTLSRFPTSARRGIVRAVNRAGAVATTLSKRVIAKELGIKQTDLINPHRFGAVGSQSTGKALRLEKANDNNLTATLKVSGRRIPVAFFKARATPITEQQPILVNRKGMRFVARRRGQGVGWKIGAKSSFERQSFMAKVRSGHVGVWVRNPRHGKYDGRLPIRELKGPSIPGAASRSPDFRRAMSVDVTNTLVKELDRQIDLILKNNGLLPNVGGEAVASG